MSWRTRAGSTFQTEKRPVHAARGMVVTNHPLASAAGAEMLARHARAGIRFWPDRRTPSSPA